MMSFKRLSVLAAAVVVLAGSLACHEPPPPIHVDGARLTVDNQTDQEWSHVEIWLNDHYRVIAPSLKARQRLIVPLDTFVEGYGRRFDRKRQYPSSIELTATASDGKPVRLVWGKERWKPGVRPKDR
jgi:hypothetical protein